MNNKQAANKKVASVRDRLEEAMADAGKKQVDLVRETGLDKGSISSYLSGKYEPKSKAIGLLSRALGVSEMWLWGYDVPKGRTPEQKKNDDLVGIIEQLRSDSNFFNVVSTLAQLPAGSIEAIAKSEPDFFNVISMLAQLPAEEYASIRQLMTTIVGKK